MYGLGAPGTVLAEPWDDSAQAAGDGEGSQCAAQVFLQDTVDAMDCDLDADAHVSLDGCIRHLIDRLGDDGSWIKRELDANSCPRSAAALAEVEAQLGATIAEAWKSVTTAAVKSIWTWAAAETIFCDIGLRGVLELRVPKDFSLARVHALPPWVQPRVTRLADGRLQASKLHDLRDDLRALGLTVPSDEERHTLSAWRDAVYDQAGESLIEPMLGAGDKRRSLLQRWFRSHELAMPKAKSKLALETAMRAHVNTGQVSGSAAVRTANAGRSAGDELLRRCALRLHCDTNDKYHTHIMEVRSPGMGDARLTLDVRASDMARECS